MSPRRGARRRRPQPGLRWGAGVWGGGRVPRNPGFLGVRGWCPAFCLLFRASTHWRSIPGTALTRLLHAALIATSCRLLGHAPLDSFERCLRLRLQRHTAYSRATPRACLTRVRACVTKRASTPYAGLDRSAMPFLRAARAATARSVLLPCSLALALRLYSRLAP